MGWTTPADWSYKEAPGSEKLNTQIRDNMIYLKASLPVGVIIESASPNTPDQYLPADGAAVSRATYAALFAEIGTLFGVGDGSTTFNLPNRKGKAGVGYDASQAEFNTTGKTGGAKTHTLSTAEMPVHNHGITDPGHEHLTPGGVNGGTNHYRIDALNNWNRNTAGATTGITINNAGGGTSHNNLQPYIVLHYYIKF